MEKEEINIRLSNIKLKQYCKTLEKKLSIVGTNYSLLVKQKEEIIKKEIKKK